MGIGICIIVALLLLAATVIMHYEFLQFAGTLPRRLSYPTRSRIIIVIGVVLAAHVLEAGLYAVAYYAIQAHFGAGGLAGHLEGDPLDFFYFSMATYTTLGIGDLHPSGAMRIVASIESLNGLVLIGWSASFTYLTMEDLWGTRRGHSAKTAP